LKADKWDWDLPTLTSYNSAHWVQISEKTPEILSAGPKINESRLMGKSKKKVGTSK
jgi:hypothetical protein